MQEELTDIEFKVKIPQIINQSYGTPIFQPIIQFKDSYSNYAGDHQFKWQNDKSERIAPINLILETKQTEYNIHFILKKAV